MHLKTNGVADRYLADARLGDLFEDLADRTDEDAPAREKVGIDTEAREEDVKGLLDGVDE